MVNILRTVVPAVGAAAGLASAARVGGLHGAAHRRQNDVASGSIGALQIGSLCQFSEAYADHGTGSAMDLSMFQPDDHCESSKQREWYEIGHFGMSGCVRGSHFFFVFLFHWPLWTLLYGQLLTQGRPYNPAVFEPPAMFVRSLYSWRTDSLLLPACIRFLITQIPLAR